MNGKQEIITTSHHWKRKKYESNSMFSKYVWQENKKYSQIAYNEKENIKDSDKKLYGRKTLYD